MLIRLHLFGNPGFLDDDLAGNWLQRIVRLYLPDVGCRSMLEFEGIERIELPPVRALIVTAAQTMFRPRRHRGSAQGWRESHLVVDFRVILVLSRDLKQVGAVGRFIARGGRRSLAVVGGRGG